MNKISLYAVAIAAAALPADAMATPDSSSTFGVSLTVPGVCDLSAGDFVIDQSQTFVTGYVREYCNSSQGFQVLASHRPLENGEAVELYYGGDISQLDPAGLSSVAFRAGPRLDTVPVKIEAAGLDTPLAVSFSLTAI